MLPDLRLLLAAMALTILLVMKLGSNIVATASDPYIGLSDVAQVRRSVVPQALQDNPEQRQLQTLAVSRRIDELHRLLDLPGGTVSFTDKSSDASGGANLSNSVNTTAQPVYAPPAATLSPARQDPDDAVAATEQRGDGVAAGPANRAADPAPDVTGSIAADPREPAATPVVVLSPESSEVAPDRESPEGRVAGVTATADAAATRPTPEARPALSVRPSRGRHPAIHKKVAARRTTPARAQTPKVNADNPFSPMFGNNQ
jgi:hypothetical protein